VRERLIVLFVMTTKSSKEQTGASLVESAAKKKMQTRKKYNMSAISKQLKYIREAARASAASSIARHNVEARNAKKKIQCN
jgi:hypothetical protein